jgi:hypothetical protein
MPCHWVQLQTQGCSFPVAAAGAPVAGLMCAPSMRMRCLKAPCSASPCKPSWEPFQRRNRRSLFEAGDVGASTLRRALERMGLSGFRFSTAPAAVSCVAVRTWHRATLRSMQRSPLPTDNVRSALPGAAFAVVNGYMPCCTSTRHRNRAGTAVQPRAALLQHRTPPAAVCDCHGKATAAIPPRCDVQVWNRGAAAAVDGSGACARAGALPWGRPRLCRSDQLARRVCWRTRHAHGAVAAAAN